jgi:hypothetical protein
MLLAPIPMVGEGRVRGSGGSKYAQGYRNSEKRRDCGRTLHLEIEILHLSRQVRNLSGNLSG